MRGDHIGMQVYRKIYNCFGFWYLDRIFLWNLKSMATQISAQRRDDKAIVCTQLPYESPLIYSEVLWRHFSLDCIALNAFSPKYLRFFDSFTDGKLE
jgi:hypothetical protein